MDSKEDAVFDLLTELCTKTAVKYTSNRRISQKKLVNKMRSRSYEIILKKSAEEIPQSSRDPLSDMLCYYFINRKNSKNVGEYKRLVELKKSISALRCKGFGDRQDAIHNVLKFLVCLSDSVKEDISMKLYQSPFTFGDLDKMLPKPPAQSFGSPQPYSYYPSHVFELPYSLRCQANKLEKDQSQTYTEYTVQSFESKSLLADIRSPQLQSSEVKTFLSPISLVSMTSTHLSPYSDTMFYPRLTAPRDLKIPGSGEVDVKVSFQSTTAKSEMREVYRASGDDGLVDIWELATQVDKDIPDDIWEFVAKLPPITERQLIASSPREMRLWRLLHEDTMADLQIISEKQFIRHVMYLIIGIETTSFPFNEEWNCFTMRENLVLEGISRDKIRGYVSELLMVGTYYRRLYKFAFNQIADDHFHTRGLVYEAAREVIRRYLLEFRLLATEIYEQCNKSSVDGANCIPTLLQILHHVETKKYEIETIASIYKMADGETNTLPQGAELMSYLFNEIYLVTHKKTALTMFNSLFSLCKVYFKFIERFIFEGELDDHFDEFFIRKDSQYINSRSKRYWDKGFHITQSVAIPEFLRALAKFILLCGKSLRLLKMCNPSDPLLLLISSDHPSISCCASFEALSRQQQLLDVYRTRCLFVSGEPASFQQIMLKREAERKAFTEMAALKQAETMDKIVAERKRLAQLIIAEKQHSLRVLEAAMAETKAAKSRSKRREKIRSDLQKAADAASDQIDAKIRDDEKNKLMEYYSKLNIEVERSKIHTEWKIKRLQLDESRIQLLSTEERNLKREKLELEHQRNEECMAMSIQSIDHDDENDGKDISNPTSDEDIKITELNEMEDSPVVQSQTVFSAICNAAKSIFGVSKSDEKCDNKKKLDAQGNVVETHTTSSAVIGKNINEAYDNVQFLKMRQEALVNKQKVMAHEFGHTDEENNRMKDLSLTSIIDEENNLQDWSPFAEARRNKLKVLGAEFGMKVTEVTKAEPITDAQKEALINKQKILGVEYNLPPQVIVKNDPANVAQEEAVRNKKKVLGSEGSEYGSVEYSPRRDAKKNLTLNLKPYGECSSKSVSVTPNTGAVTPGDLFPRLDLETPTTAEIHLEGPMTSDIFSPRSECKEIESMETIQKEYISTDGFAFPIIDDETVDSEVISDAPIQSPENSPSKTIEATFRRRLSKNVFDILDSSYNLADFDPFGVKEWEKYSKDYFNKKMDEDMAYSCYTHPAVIMEEVKKSPYTNIFAHFGAEDKEESITCDNIATLTACLQRSVMLPLTYQLEVVNNSILTYFLVNLDMYEHLRCLKDYFFLMDGEFSTSICHNLFSKLSKTLNPHELLNFATLHNILDKALGSSISHGHKFSEKLSFMMSEPPLSLQHSSPDALSCLSLTCAVSWPLNIILSNEALLRYARVFQFLLKMRRIFWVLGEDFQLLKQAAKQNRKLMRSPQYRSVQVFRHTMASLLRALDNYIVTTCILTSWVEFENDLKKARTLDDLYDCHVVYIKKVLFRCLLNNRSTPVMKLLNDIFTVILKFSRVLKAGEWRQKEPNGYFTHSNFNQLQELFHLFEKLAKVVHKVVTRLMECGYQRHLVELLTMINLNGYYDPEKSKEEQNTSAKENSLNISGI